MVEPQYNYPLIIFIFIRVGADLENFNRVLKKKFISSFYLKFNLLMQYIFFKY